MKSTLLTLTLLTFSTIGEARRPIPETEDPSLLTDRKEITSLFEVRRVGLNEGNTGIDLWSGSYWPHYQGSLAVRYRENNFIKLIDEKEQWNDFKETYEKFPYYTFFNKLDLLSPAEKYDLVVGDRAMGLTKYSWELGEKANIIGSVPTWRGICDGWASASQMMPRPVNSVSMKTPEGQKN